MRKTIKNKIQDLTVPASYIEEERRNARLSINYKHLGFGGQRGRLSEHRPLINSYVDYYSSELMVLSIVIMTLSSLDAFFTLTLISKGAIELNVFMDILLKTSTPGFVLYKVALTGLCTLFLIIHHNFLVLRLFKAEKILYVLALCYFLLILWELHLLF